MQKIKTLIFDFGDVFINLDKIGAMQNALDLFQLKTFENDMIAANIQFETGGTFAAYLSPSVALAAGVVRLDGKWLITRGHALTVIAS